MKKFSAKVLVLVMATVLFCSCGKVLTLETVFNSAAGQKQIEETKASMMESFAGYYSDFDMYAEGNNLIYKYYFAPEMDEMADTLKETLPTSADWESEIEKVKDDVESSSKIRPESITYAYYTSEGEEIFSVTK